MNEDEIKQFWQAHPCGDHQVAGFTDDHETFFTRYDTFRYQREPHILDCLAQIDFAKKHVLEIGLGQGADSERIIRAGAIWSGLDLTPESVERVEQRLQNRHLPFERLECGSALKIPFADGSFDIVFCHGVLHHIPDIYTAQREISRVLKPGGELIMMVYAKRSLNYLIAITFVRRLALAVCYLVGIRPSGIAGVHIDNARKIGLLNYLKMKHFIHKNTDGPLNPYSKVYTLRTVSEDFPDFIIKKSYQRWMHAPPLPVGWLSALQNLLGWHLWVHMIARKQSS